MQLKALSISDLEQVRQWRNDQLLMLRTPFLLTQEQQEKFYRDVICNRKSNARYWGVWEKEKNGTLICGDENGPYIKHYKKELIGMAGLENIQWENRLAEISLVLKPDYTIDANFPNALWMLLCEGFMNMNLDNIYTEVYDCNQNIHLWLAAEAEYCCKTAMLPFRKYHKGQYWNSRYINFNKEDFLGHENTLS